MFKGICKCLFLLKFCGIDGKLENSFFNGKERNCNCDQFISFKFFSLFGHKFVTTIKYLFSFNNNELYLIP